VFRAHFQKLNERLPEYVLESIVLELLVQNPTINGLEEPPSVEEILAAARNPKNKGSGESGLTRKMFSLKP